MPDNDEVGLFNLPVVSWEYVAGFFDGEGCITMSLRDDGLPFLVVSMAQKEREVLEDIRSLTGGKIWDRACNGVNVWQLCFRNAESQLHLLRNIQPFCRRRPKKIAFAIAFAEAKLEVKSIVGKSAQTNYASKEVLSNRLFQSKLFESFKSLERGD